MNHYGIITDWVDASWTDETGYRHEFIYPVFVCDVMAKSESLAIFCVMEMKAFDEFEIELKNPTLVIDLTMQHIDEKERSESLMWQRTWN